MLTKFRLFHLEDDDNDAFLLSKGVERTQRPCTLMRFRHGIEAKQALEEITAMETEAPHLIISDLKMPQMNGLEFTSWLRQTRFSCVPVVILTGSALLEDRAAAYRAGANSFASKPPSIHELYDMVAIILKYWSDVCGAMRPIFPEPPGCLAPCNPPAR
jgi:CheY-like chemotaxis protein